MTTRTEIARQIETAAKAAGLGATLTVASTGSAYLTLTDRDGGLSPQLRFADHHGPMWRPSINIDTLAEGMEIVSLVASGGCRGLCNELNRRADALREAARAADRAAEIARQARFAHRRMMQPSRTTEVTE